MQCIYVLYVDVSFVPCRYAVCRAVASGGKGGGGQPAVLLRVFCTVYMPDVLVCICFNL